MQYIAHRINTVAELEQVPTEYGVELDLRDYGDRLVIQHDPFKDGEDFETYLKSYRHGTMILNIKSERIEPVVLELIKKYSIKDYFFLDSSFPMIYWLMQQGEKNCAIRISEYESLDNALILAGHLKWIWVDCFSQIPLDRVAFKLLKQAGFNLCLVSPELQGRDSDIEASKAYLNMNEMAFDAVCTKVKNIARWQS